MKTSRARRVEASTKNAGPSQPRDRLYRLIATRISSVPPAEPPAPVSTTPRISIQWVLVLGVLLAISVLCNVLLVANR